jgi:hypothetical protein
MGCGELLGSWTASVPHLEFIRHYLEREELRQQRVNMLLQGIDGCRICRLIVVSLDSRFACSSPSRKLSDASFPGDWQDNSL